MQMKGSLMLCFLLFGFVSHAVCRKLEDSVVKPDCDCPTPSHHGSHGSPPLPKPKPTPKPSTPSHGGGSYYPPHSSPTNSPPAVVTPSPPAVIVPPVTPTPVTPVNPAPPTTPSIDPSVPPFAPGSCSYWINHPAAVWAIFGSWGTMGQSFGAACGTALAKHNIITLQDALKNTRTDGIGALYREGTTALLNSIACTKYSFTTQQVKDAFATAIVTSDKAAASQALIFKQANEGGLGH